MRNVKFIQLTLGTEDIIFRMTGSSWGTKGAAIGEEPQFHWQYLYLCIKPDDIYMGDP